MAATLALVALAGPFGPAARAGEHPKGDIEWVQGLDEAAALAKRSGKPLIAYFTFDT
jgi:hypothetical protein